MRPGRGPFRNRVGEITQGTVGAGYCKDRTEGIFRVRIILVTGDHGQTGWRGARFQNIDGLRMAVLRDKEHRARVRFEIRLMTWPSPRHMPFPHPAERHWRFQARQIATMVWKFSNASRPPLRNFRLIGRVGRIPGRIFQNVALDRGRGDGCRDSPCQSARVHRVGVGRGLAGASAAPRFRTSGVQNRAALLDGYWPERRHRSACQCSRRTDDLEQHFPIFFGPGPM